MVQNDFKETTQAGWYLRTYYMPFPYLFSNLSVAGSILLCLLTNGDIEKGLKLFLYHAKGYEIDFTVVRIRQFKVAS
jgi:hypothetical protein